MRKTIALVAVLGAALVGLSGGYALGSTTGRHDVQVVRGFTSAVNFDGTAIGLTRSQDAEEGEGFYVAGALWRSRDRAGWGRGPGSTGAPTCLEPLTSGQEVRLGVLKARPGPDSPGTSVVVWLECLTGPAERFG